MPTYTYNNGNFSSTTSIVNGISYTQNIMMLGATGNGCGDSPCPQGYSLYFPCLKNITRGEDACFDFYVVDNVTKDVVDLRTVESLSIILTGNFGCQLGTYTYPSDNNYIRPLQKEDYKTLLDEDFVEREVFELKVVSVDTSLEQISEANIDGNVGKYYEGDTAYLKAFDTESYIFVGWIDLDSELDDECDDYFISVKNSISIEMNGDKNIAAVYRKRKTFIITTVEENSFFSYYKDGDEVPLSNGHVVKEGEFIIVRSIPVNCIFSKWDTSDFGTSTHTSDGNIIMQIEVKSNITLKIESIDVYDSDFGSEFDDTGLEIFEINFIGFPFKTLISLCTIDKDKGKIEKHETGVNKLSEDIVYLDNKNVSEIFGSTEPVGYKNLYCYGMGENTILKLGDNTENGYIVIPNPGVEKETIIEIYCMKHEDCNTCSICVSLDDDPETQQIEDVYEDGVVRFLFTFEKTDFKEIKISTLGEIFPEEKPGFCFIDKIVVSDISIIDKGKATLCLPGSVTSKFYRGKIIATGAIMINGSSHGLPCTPIGTVTNNPVINTIVI